MEYLVEQLSNSKSLIYLQYNFFNDSYYEMAIFHNSSQHIVLLAGS